jgi:hypothetical protein
MASQVAIRVVRMEKLTETRVRATLELACGCEVTREIAADRIVDDAADGVVRAVGKYPCPVDHPVAVRA